MPKHETAAGMPMRAQDDWAFRYYLFSTYRPKPEYDLVFLIYRRGVESPTGVVSTQKEDLTPMNLTRAGRRDNELRGAFRGRQPWLYFELGKARLTTLVTLTTLAGYVISAEHGVDGWRLLWTLAGTALAAWGANALNQWMELRPDARMRRTRQRPVPSGRLAPRHALAAALAGILAGSALLTARVNVLTAGLALLATALYIGAYTPLKSRTPFCTLVGAACGAIPPMMGCSAALGHLDHRSWILGLLLFLWQIPHSLALAWLHREDYEAGGFRLLPSVDPTGRATAFLIGLYSLALLPLSAVITLSGMAGWIYAAGSMTLGGVFVALAMRLSRDRSAAAARRLVVASVIYLPALLGLMLTDRGPARGITLSSPPARAIAALDPGSIME